MGEVLTQQPVELPSMAGYFFKTVLSLGLIIFLTYLIMQLLKKQSAWGQGQKEWIRILDYQALGGNRGIYLVEMLDSVYLLGVSEGQVNILKEINPLDDSWQILKEKLDYQETSTSSWHSWFGRFMRKGQGKVPYRSEDVTTSFKDRLEQQLKRSQQLSRQFTGRNGDDENK